jgi:hypothetical protein
MGHVDAPGGRKQASDLSSRKPTLVDLSTNFRRRVDGSCGSQLPQLFDAEGAALLAANLAEPICFHCKSPVSFAGATQQLNGCACGSRHASGFAFASVPFAAQRGRTRPL